MQYTFKLIEQESGRVFMPAFYSSSQLSSNFKRLQNESTVRMLNGTPERASLDWEKGSITIRGSGTVPPGLDDLDKSKIYNYYSFLSRSSLLTYTLADVSLTSASVASALVFDVRTDVGYEPFLVVSYADGTTESFYDYEVTPVVDSSPLREYTATLKRTDVEAVHEVYFPIFSVYATPADVDYDHRSNVYGWTLDLDIL